jgi:sec-independent protein translocase protein TatA
MITVEASPFGPDLLIIVLIIVVLFGGSKLADLGKGLGQGMREFKQAIKEDEEKTPAPPAPPDLPKEAASGERESTPPG